MPSTAATTTGMYSGRQPAITALIATFSAVIETARLVMNAIWRSGSSLRRVQHGLDAGLGGRNDRKAVGPAARERQLDGLGLVTRGESLRRQGGSHSTSSRDRRTR